MSPIFKALLGSLGYEATGLILAAFAFGAGLLGQALTPFHANPVGPKRDRSLASEVLKERDFWTIWAVWALAGAAGISMVMNAVGFGLWKGFEIGDALKLLVGFNLANGLSRAIAGHLSDSIGRTRVMTWTFFASGISYMLMPHLPGLWLLVALCASVGFGFGTLFAVSAPLLAERFGLERFGEVMGLTFTAYGFLSGAIGPVISGFLLDFAKGGFELPFCYLGSLYLASALLLKFSFSRTKV